MGGIRLITNADDFGFTREVNEGIVEAHRNGILTATTLMANGAAFEHAVGLAQETPSLDIGCHLVLVERWGFNDVHAYILCSVALKLRLSQVVNEPVYTVSAALSKQILPERELFPAQ